MKDLAKIVLAVAAGVILFVPAFALTEGSTDAVKAFWRISSLVLGLALSSALCSLFWKD